MQFLNFLKNTAMVDGLLFIGATQSQPTLLPRTSGADDREQTRGEGPLAVPCLRLDTGRGVCQRLLPQGRLKATQDGVP
jgi:hypothetical protein